MCLAVPMQVERVNDDGTARAGIDGTLQTVDVSLLDSCRAGDYVIVHAGFAIETLDAEEADARLRLFEELAEVQAGAVTP